MSTIVVLDDTTRGLDGLSALVSGEVGLLDAETSISKPPVTQSLQKLQPRMPDSSPWTEGTWPAAETSLQMSPSSWVVLMPRQLAMP